jgi:hypothetical protein
MGHTWSYAVRLYIVRAGNSDVPDCLADWTDTRLAGPWLFGKQICCMKFRKLRVVCETARQSY